MPASNKVKPILASSADGIMLKNLLSRLEGQHQMNHSLRRTTFQELRRGPLYVPVAPISIDIQHFAPENSLRVENPGDKVFRRSLHLLGHLSIVREDRRWSLVSRRRYFVPSEL